MKISEMRNKKNKLMSIAFVLFTFSICFITIGSSFAIFNYTKTGDKINTVQIGDIVFSMLDGESVFIEEEFPESDIDGNKNVPYIFTVNNKSSDGLTLYYDLSFLDNNKESGAKYFKNNQIKYSLVKNDNYVAGTSSNTGKKLSEINGFDNESTIGEGIVLTNQAITAKKTDTYELRIWISDDVSYDNDIDENGLMVGKYNSYQYSLKVKIGASSEKQEVVYASGLYDIDMNLLKNWEDLLHDGDITVEDGSLAISNKSIEDILVVDSSITKIANSGFSNCTNLVRVDLPETITEISAYGFQNTPSLDTFIIPSSVTVLDSNVFSNSGVKKLINYANINFKLANLGLPNLEEFDTYNGNIEGYFVSDLNHLKKVIIGKDVTMENGAFINSKVESVTIEEGYLGEIPTQAFSGSSNLKEITLSSGITKIGNDSFYGASKLEKIDIPESVKEIGSNAFYNCSGLESVTIPTTVENIGYNAFYNCTSIKNLNLTLTNAKSIGFNAFTGVQGIVNINIIGDGTTGIGSSAFYNATDLKNVVIKNVSEIGSSALENTGVENLTLENVKSIQMSALDNSMNLKNVYLDNVPIFSSMFADRTDLTNVDLKNVTEIGYTAFKGCTSLTSLVIPSTVTAIYNDAFKNTGITHLTNNANIELQLQKFGFSNVTDLIINHGTVPSGAVSSSVLPNLSTVYIGKDVTLSSYAFAGSFLNSINIEEGFGDTIPQYAFVSCPYLTNVIIPSTVKEIGSGAFIGCQKLETVEFSDGLEVIGSSAFANCISLSGDLTLPNTVTTISDAAFNGCSNLQNVTVPSTVQLIGNNAFKDVQHITYSGRLSSSDNWGANSVN